MDDLVSGRFPGETGADGDTAGAVAARSMIVYNQSV
jgi:hypothetical protein